MKLQTRIGDPSSEEGVRLLTDSYTLMSSLFPPEDNHALSIEDFKNPNIVFLIAEKDGKPCGSSALANKATYAEINTKYVDETRPRHGNAGLITANLEAEAKRLSLPELYLETGGNLLSAIRLYKKLGFEECGPFGEYKKSPHSVFMLKKLD